MIILVEIVQADRYTRRAGPNNTFGVFESMDEAAERRLPPGTYRVYEGNRDEPGDLAYKGTIRVNPPPDTAPPRPEITSVGDPSVGADG